VSVCAKRQAEYPLMNALNLGFRCETARFGGHTKAQGLGPSDANQLGGRFRGSTDIRSVLGVVAISVG